MTYNKKGRGKVKDDNAMYYLHIVIQDSEIAAIKKCLQQFQLHSYESI